MIKLVESQFTTFVSATVRVSLYKFIFSEVVAAAIVFFIIVENIPKMVPAFPQRYFFRNSCDKMKICTSFDTVLHTQLPECQSGVCNSSVASKHALAFSSCCPRYHCH